MKILVQGRSLPLATLRDVKKVTVQEDLAASSMFTIELFNWDQDTLRLTWSDDPLFAPGKEVSLWLGTIDNLAQVMLGEITGLEPVFQQNQLPTLIVRGYDYGHRLWRGSKTRSFVMMKDSTIAEEIALSAGLSPIVSDSQVILDYVLQHNQTDMAFLQARARRIGYEVYVREKQLYFQPPQNQAGGTITLSLDQDIVELYPRLTMMSQVGEVVVQGWNVREKMGVASKASAGEELTRMGGFVTGPSAADRAFGVSSTDLVTWPVSSLAEAERMALGKFNEMALAYITGDGVCNGRNDLRAGNMVQLEGLGQTFSGLYRVTSVTHTITPGRGYETYFTYERNTT
jgi:phage protein D